MDHMGKHHHEKVQDSKQSDDSSRTDEDFINLSCFFDINLKDKFALKC